MAITWRTLNQPTGAGVGLLMNGAARSLDGGFTALQNVLEQRNKTENANWNVQKTNNTTDYLNAVQDIRDPNALNDPTVQANLANLKQQFGYQVDSNAIRGAEDKRVQDLQQQGLQKIEFNDKTRIDSERDQVDQIAGLYQAGKYAEGDKLREGKNFRDDALLDKLRVDAQRGYSQESRSALSAADAHNSSVLNQRIGNENLTYSTRVHKDDIASRDRLQSGNDLLSSAINGWRTTQDNNTAAIGQVAKGLGIQVVNNVPILDDSVTPEKQAEFAAKLKEAGLDTAPTSTSILQAFDARLRQDPRHFTETEITNLKKGLDAGLSGTAALSTQDQADLDAKTASITAASEARLAKEKLQWDKDTRSNMFLNGATDPNITMEDIGKALKDFSPWTTNDAANKEEFIQLATQYSTDGIVVDGEKYNVPPPMIKAAMAMSADDFSDPDKGLTQALEAMIKSNPKAYKESLKLYQDHLDKVNNEKADTLRAIQSTKTQALGKAGIGPSGNTLWQVLNGNKK